MLRKQLHEVNKQSQVLRSVTSSNSSYTEGDTITSVSNASNMSVTPKVITKCKNTTLIAQDGTKAELISPLPGIHWKCLGVDNGDGLITLEKTFTAIILQTDNTNYVLGIIGETNEFELTFGPPENQIKLNHEFFSTTYKHLLKNGVEEK